MINRLALLCGLSVPAACVDQPQVDEIESGTVRDPTCTGFDLKLYSGTNYTGNVLCLEGLGSISVARLVTIGSYQSGQWAGSFDHKLPVPPVLFHPGQEVPVAVYPVTHAGNVHITGSYPDGGIDGGP